MGKVLFSIVLVAAAFAGGAAINGPGLHWLQTKIGILANEEDHASQDKDQSPDGASISTAEVPTVQVSPLVNEPPPTGPAPVKSPVPASPDPAPSTPRPDEASAATPSVPEPSAPAPIDLKDLGPKLGGEPADPKPTAAPAPEENKTAAGGPGPPWSDMPGSAPAAAVVPRPRTRPDAAEAPEPESRSVGDWAEIRRRMRELGVARYGIEGEAGGRVRFHCLIPLVGKGAVAQQFEAEASDEFQAAQTALRRVALWRATEEEHAAPAQ